MKNKILYSIEHCRAIDADFDRTGINEEEAVNPEDREQAAAAAQSEESDHQRVNLFGENESNSNGVFNNDYGEEEEE